MQIESLKVFCDLVETESFTKAAQVNGVTQSAVSQTIGALERQFKSLLVERSKKQFRVTREGQLLYDYCKRIVGTFESLQHKIQEVQEIISGTIRVGATYSIGLHDLPPYLKRFLNDCPTVNVQVEYRPASEVYEGVLSNLMDVGLVAYPAVDRRLQAVPLRKDPLGVICHPQHQLAKLKQVKLKALQGQKFVAFGPEMPTRRAVDKLLRRHGVRVEVVMEFDNVETVKHAVEIDAGIAIVPLVTVKKEVARQLLAAAKIDEGEVSRPLAAIYKTNRVLSPAMEQFIALLKQPL